MRRSVFRLSIFILALFTAVVPAVAQTAFTGAITVRATDSTGAVIPGVEVSISSPAMIGGGRNAVTEESGSFRFTDLVIGTYRVSFALPGFKTLNIDGNIVAAGRTLTVPGIIEVA